MKFMKLGRFNINLQRIGILVGLGVLLLMIMNFNARMSELVRLQNQAATVQAQATDVAFTQVALETQAAYATSDKAVEEWAREQARLALPGDQVVIPIPAPGSTPQPTPSPTPILQNLTKLDIWIELLFGP